MQLVKNRRKGYSAKQLCQQYIVLYIFIPLQWLGFEYYSASQLDFLCSLCLFFKLWATAALKQDIRVINSGNLALITRAFKLMGCIFRFNGVVMDRDSEWYDVSGCRGVRAVQSSGLSLW